MEISSNIKRYILKVLFLVFACCIVLWFSVVCYLLLYYIYIPSVAHIKPVHLEYDSYCSEKKKCSFPHARLKLVEEGQYELLSGGQAYAVEVDLEMPESEHNLNQGVFMIQLNMVSEKGNILRSSTRPAILRYRSPLFKVIYTLFFTPALLAGTVEEKQSLSVPLFENYVESCNTPTYFAQVTVEALSAEVYSCTLKIHAQFTGLRYMMYYWPTLSAVIGIGTNFFLVSIMLIFIWVRQIMNAPQYINLAHLSEQERGLVNEIRESVQKDQALRASRMPTPSSGISRRRYDSLSTEHDGEDIENLSSYAGISQSETQQDSSSIKNEECSSGESEFSVCSQDEPVSEIDNILNIGKAFESSPSSPSLRRRAAVAESDI